MKKMTMTILTALATMLAGCLVTSLNPFYTEQDLVFEPGLLGRWMPTNSEQGLLTNKVIEFKREGEQGYLTVCMSQNEGGKTDTNQALVRLFKLGDQLFLDNLPQNPHGPEFVPVHRLFKVISITPTLQTREMSYEWLKKLLEDDPASLRHETITERNSEDAESSTRLVLTASTKDLQAFLRQHLATEKAWQEISEFLRPPAASTAAVQSKALDTIQGH